MTAKAIHVNAYSMYVTAKLAIAHGRMLEQCLGFKTERYAAGNAGEIERPSRSSREHEPPRIPECDREHIVKLVQEVEAAVLVEMDEHLDIGMVGGKAVAGAL
jgi:hypothetical protein